jgi:rhamnogalacturonyl hydrolase YesR
MKFSSFVSVILLFLVINVRAQENNITLLKKIVDVILSEDNSSIKVATTGELINDLNKLPPEGRLTLASPYKNWYYWNGVMNIAMLEMYEQFKDERYRNFALNNYRFVFDNYENLKKLTLSKRLRGLEQHWDIYRLDCCGSMAAGLIEVYQIDKRKDYYSYFETVSDYILNKEFKLADGTLARNEPYDKTVWLDDLYMSVPFLARMGKMTGDKKYFDFAVKQIKQFTKLLYDEHTGLYFHSYADDIKQVGVAHWGRANGWSIMAQAHLLEFLPANHPERPEILRIFKQQITGFARYQAENGLWHQLLDKSDSYYETSCTAMFTYAVAKGINEGWLEPRYKPIAIEGWKGIASMVNAEGKVENICIGTGISEGLIHYYKRPVATNDIHGLAAVVIAGVEVSKLTK